MTCSILMSDYMYTNLILTILMFILLLTSLTSVTFACLLKNLSNYLSFSQMFKRTDSKVMLHDSRQMLSHAKTSRDAGAA